MKRIEIYKVIDEERSYQDDRWGGDSHDSKKSVGDFIIYMEEYISRAKKIYTTDAPVRDSLNELRKVVTLGVACFEQHRVPRRKLEE